MVNTASRSFPWVPLVLTVLFTAATTSLLSDYSRLHWRLLSDHYSELSDDVRQPLFSLLGWLHLYRLFAALLAVACAAWASFSPPRWAGIVAVLIASFAVLEVLIMM
jgi:hypothetical protein